MNETIARFNALKWHDSKLLGLSFAREGTEEQVRLSLEMRGEQGTLVPMEMIFKGSTYIALEVDLEGKHQCSNDISDARCCASSEWTKMLSDRNPYDSFSGFLHFEIDLIPPGGNINILAKDFVTG